MSETTVFPQTVSSLDGFHPLIVSSLVYTANVLTIKTMGTGNCGGPAGKTCTIYGKEYKNCGETP